MLRVLCLRRAVVSWGLRDARGVEVSSPVQTGSHPRWQLKEKSHPTLNTTVVSQFVFVNLILPASVQPPLHDLLCVC